MSGLLRGFFGGPADAAPAGGTTPLWLITLTDLMGILLAFFVLIFAATAPSGEAWSALRASFTGEAAAGADVSGGSKAGKAGLAAASEAAQGRLKLGYLSAVLEQHGAGSLSDRAALARQHLDRAGDRLVLSIHPGRLIPQEANGFTIEGTAFLRRLSAVLQHAANPLHIRIAGAPGPQGWARVFSRAQMLREALRAGGYTGTIDISTQITRGDGRIALVIAGDMEANW